MRRYDSYKDCGQQWLGKIPSHWEIQKIKFLASCNDETLPENYDENEVIKYIEISDVSSNEGIKNYTEYYFKDAPSRARRITQQNDIIVSTVRTYLKAIAKIEQSGFVVSTGFAVLRPQKINKSFLGYAVLTETFVNEVVSKSVGASYPSINALELINIKIVLPLEFEQQAIASYLDKQCENIDKAIAQQQRMIDLLNERKQIIIQQAVTKGLNPNVKMKDSGVEWIGQVPEHWKIRRFKNCVQIRSNLVHPSEFLDYPQISPECIEKNTGILMFCETVRDTGIISDNHLFYKGQIIYSKIRPTLNKAFIADFDGLCSADMYPIETTNNTEYILYVLLSYYFSDQVQLVVNDRVKMPKINQEELGNIIIALPPKDEQQSISLYIKEQIGNVMIAINKAYQTIDLLKERKQIIINDVVTGKIKII